MWKEKSTELIIYFLIKNKDPVIFHDWRLRISEFDTLKFDHRKESPWVSYIRPGTLTCTSPKVSYISSSVHLHKRNRTSNNSKLMPILFSLSFTILCKNNHNLERPLVFPILLRIYIKNCKGYIDSMVSWLRLNG